MILPFKQDEAFSAKEQADHSTRYRKGLVGISKEKIYNTLNHDMCPQDRNFNFIYCNRNCKFRKLMVTV